MIPFLLGAALASAALASPAQASPTIQTLFRTLQASGTSVVKDSSVCKDTKLLGLYEHQYNVVNRITLCVANHKGDSAELYDTILHEAVHVAQVCRGGPLLSPRYVQANSKPGLAVAIAKEYPSKQTATELEAHFIAANYDEVFVTDQLKKYCL